MTTRLPAKVPMTSRARMNDLEDDYASYLDGEPVVVSWWYQPERLRVGVAAQKGKADAFWTPDFRVQLADGTIEFHETKGRWTRDARAMIRAAVLLHPYVFRGVQLKKSSRVLHWSYETFTPGAADWLSTVTALRRELGL